MNKIDSLLSPSQTALRECGIVQGNEVTEDVYDGYLAGFGPAVITSGLIQTLAVYEAHDKHRKVLNAISRVANINNCNTGNALLSLCLQNHSNKLQINIWREKIIDASVALKMMIRTYNLNR